VEPFQVHTGLAVPLPRIHVDTDQIVPKRFLKSIERTGFAPALFADWRFLPDGRENPEFVLNLPRYRGASILVTGRDFGCGSSREHAAWALRDYGFRAVVSPSFGDIFRANAVQNGLLPAQVGEEEGAFLVEVIQAHPGYTLTVDLVRQRITGDHGVDVPFSIAPESRWRLLEGLDDIGLTLRHEAAISAYEERRRLEGWG
jgi:3-isopropylmalate/(R)-2-methylmalate dehydratase small subunit